MEGAQDPKPNVKQEETTENGTPNQQNAGGHGGQQHQQGGHGHGGGYHGGRGRGGMNRFGNRRPPHQQQQNNAGDEKDFGRRRPGGRGGHQGGPRDQQMGPRNPDDRLMEKLSQIGGPSFDLPPLDMTERKFAGRNRLYIGNIPNDVTEDEINELFQKYGEASELFINKEKNFGFIRLDFHCNAEKAKRELDGHVVRGRNLKIRFAPNGSTIKVKNLTSFITNELLHIAFSIFGDIERCMVIVDDRGKSTGEGIVEFARKGSATNAVRKCTEACYFLTSSLRPVIVEMFEALDDCDGYPEKNLHRKNQEFMKSREVGPRFAAIGSFEHEYGMRWKALHELHAQKELALKKELEVEQEKLEAQMEYARYEQETEMLREQLRARELDKERQKREWEIKERQAEEARQRAEEQMRRQEEEMQARIMHQEEEMRRRQQENSLFMQAHQLDNMLEQQEQAYDQPASRPIYNSDLTQEVTEHAAMDPKTFMNTYDRNHRYDGREMGQSGPRMGGGNMGGRWVNENRSGNVGGGGRDDFPNKRRRY